MIKKYQDMIGNILATFVDVVDEDKTYGFYHNSEHYYNTDYYTQNKHYFDELEKLAIEKDEQESRKDKLIVGSEWVCEVDCYHRHGEHDSGNIILVNELMGNDVRYSNSKEDLCEMTINQFLVCFKPLKEGE